MLCVIIPSLNSESSLAETLANVRGIADDLIVSEGGSTDATLKIALLNGARIAAGCAGRGWQMARAAKFSDADWFLFLHADTRLGEGYEPAIQSHIQNHTQTAAYFKLRFDVKGWKPRVLEWLVTIRSRWFGLPYGDQGLLISKALYEEVGGFPKVDLFEDVAIVRALGRRRLRPLKPVAITDAAKFERDGYFKRGFRNFRLMRRYLRGDDIDELKRVYHS